MYHYAWFYCFLLTVGYGVLVTFGVLYRYNVINNGVFTTGMIMGAGFSMLVSGNVCIALYAARIVREDIRVSPAAPVVPVVPPSPPPCAIAIDVVHIERGEGVAIGKLDNTTVVVVQP
jgi:hypothetical protein